MTRGKPEETCGDFGGRRNDGSKCGRASGWGTPDDSGKCKECKGVKPDGSVPDDHGAPVGNGNATSHFAFRKPEYLQDDIQGTQYEDLFIASFEALCTRHEEIYGEEPDYFARRRIRRLVLKDIKEELIDVYLAERQGTANSDNPLVERQTEDIDGPMDVERANKLLSEMTNLSREIRLALKDRGYLRDPQSQQASATQTIADVMQDELSE
jgi:hypothetical protein